MLLRAIFSFPLDSSTVVASQFTKHVASIGYSVFISQCSKRNYRRLPVRIKTCTRSEALLLAYVRLSSFSTDFGGESATCRGLALAHAFQVHRVCGKNECERCCGSVSALAVSCVLFASSTPYSSYITDGRLYNIGSIFCWYPEFGAAWTKTSRTKEKSIDYIRLWCNLESEEPGHIHRHRFIDVWHGVRLVVWDWIWDWTRIHCAASRHISIRIIFGIVRI